MKTKKNGRPTKYKPEYADDILEFFSLDEPSYRENITRQGTVQMVARRMPTMERFASEIGVNFSTLYRWSTATRKGTDEPLHPDFCNAYTRAKDCQMAYILEAGVVGALNSSFLNLYMKNAFGWKDKSEQEVTHSASIDLKAIEQDLAEAAEINAQKYAEMREKGLLGKFDT